MLTTTDKKFIADVLSESSERYPLSLAYTFKGKQAFDLHAAMISLDEDWLQSISEADKKKSLMVVVIQKTVSKATLKNADKQPPVGRQRLLVVFDVPGSSPVRSATGYSSAHGKKWLKLLEEA